MGFNRNLGNIPQVITELNGNIGIGTTLPSRKLQVEATGNDGIHIQTTNEAQLTMGAYDSTSSIYYCGYDGTGLYYTAPASQINKGSLSGITYPINYYSGGANGNNSYLAFQTQSSEKMRITSGGNVGIGTTSPVDKLDVNGIFRSIVTSISSTGEIAAKILGYPTSPFGLIFRSYSSGATSIQSQREASNSELFPLLLQPLGGNVGIGTASPGQKLHVNGSTIATSTLNSTDGAFLIDHPSVNTWKMGITNSNTSTFSIGNDIGGAFVSKILNITNSGNVGIGTISPSGKLHVVDPSNFFVASFTGNGSNTLAAGTYGSTPSVQGFTSGGGNATMALQPNGGNVLVGTTTDNGYKLQVDGSASATSLSLSGNFNATVPTNSGWTSYQTLISPGTLTPYKTYMISIWWHFGAGSNQPYYYTCSFLWSGCSTNGNGTDNEFTPIGATHTGGTGASMSFRSIGAAQSTTGIQARLNGFATTGGDIYVRATIMQGF